MRIDNAIRPTVRHKDDLGASTESVVQIKN